MLNIPVNNFSVMSGWSHRFLGTTSTFQGVNVFAQGHNTGEVGIEPLTSRSRVIDSTTRPPHSPKFCMSHINIRQPPVSWKICYFSSFCNMEGRVNVTARLNTYTMQIYLYYIQTLRYKYIQGAHEQQCLKHRPFLYMYIIKIHYHN